MAWSTQDELKFLEGLGGWKRDAPRDTREKYFRRRKLLTGYRRSMDLRKCWNGISRSKVLEYLDRSE